MPELKPGSHPSCPFCGAAAVDATDGFGRIKWECGSYQYSSEPWQDQNCQINTLEAALERAAEQLRRAKAITLS